MSVWFARALFFCTFSVEACESVSCEMPDFENATRMIGSLECAEESLELSTVRTLAERVLPCDEHFVQTNSNEFLQWDGVAEDDDVDDDSLAFTWDPGGASSTESEAGVLGIFDGT